MDENLFRFQAFISSLYLVEICNDWMTFDTSTKTTALLCWPLFIPTQCSVLSSLNPTSETTYQEFSTATLVLNKIILWIAVMSLNNKNRLQHAKQKDSETHTTLVCLGFTCVGVMQSPLIDCIQPDGYISAKEYTVYIDVMMCKSSHNRSAFRPFISASVCSGFPTEIRI